MISYAQAQVKPDDTTGSGGEETELLTTKYTNDTNEDVKEIERSPTSAPVSGLIAEH